MNLRLRTPRLELIAATVEHLQAELSDRVRFAALINARVPDEWPPPLNDDDSLKWFLAFLRDNPGAVGWGMWYFVLEDASGRIVIGNGGLKGTPDADGSVEIGYSVIEVHQRKGYASEAVAALIAWAFDHAEVTQVTAETYPEIDASIRVMEKNGLRFVGEGSEDGVIRYGITRQQFDPHL